MNKILIVFLVVAAPMVALAAGSVAHGEGIPSSVIYQAINFTIYAALLFFLLRKPIKGFFSGREQDFKQALIKAEAARRDAEQKKREVQERLTKLESNAGESLAKAKAEAEALKAKILQDAQALSANLREEARRTAALEIDRAKNELREELLGQAVALSRKMLEDKMAEQDQKRLQTEFVDKIQVVR